MKQYLSPLPPFDPKIQLQHRRNTARLARARKQLNLILKSYESHHNQYREEYGLLKAAVLVLAGAEKWLS